MVVSDYTTMLLILYCLANKIFSISSDKLAIPMGLLIFLLSNNHQFDLLLIKKQIKYIEYIFVYIPTYYAIMIISA